MPGRVQERAAKGPWPRDPEPCLNLDCLVKRGIIAGIVAGVIEDIFFIVVSWAATGSPFGGARAASAIILGTKALNSAYPLYYVLPVGLAVHFSIAILCGAVFGALVAKIPTLGASLWAFLFSGMVYGLVVWFINYHIIAPLFQWTWFTANANSPIAIVGHVFFFGAIIALYLHHYARAGEAS